LKKAQILRAVAKEKILSLPFASRSRWWIWGEVWPGHDGAGIRQKVVFLLPRKHGSRGPVKKLSLVIHLAGEVTSETEIKLFHMQNLKKAGSPSFFFHFCGFS